MKTKTTLSTPVMEAYSDCWDFKSPDTLKSNVFDRRNLHFRDNMQYSREEAYNILREAIPDGYNEFEASLLRFLPEDAKITIGREYSVCLYVQTKTKPSKKLKYNELHKEENGEWRIWWD